MSKRILIIEIIAAVITVLAGILLHFVWDFAGESFPILAYIVPTNESVFDHLKLLITPLLFATLIEWFLFGRKHLNFFPAKAIGLWLGIAFQLGMFYTYTGIFGTHLLISDILCYVGAVILAYSASYLILISEDYQSDLAGLLGRIGLSLSFLLMILFTYAPPNLPMFIPQ